MADENELEQQYDKEETPEDESPAPVEAAEQAEESEPEEHEEPKTTEEKSKEPEELDLNALLGQAYKKQLLDAQNAKGVMPSVGMSADEFMKRYNEAKESDNKARTANQIGNAFAMLGAGIGGHGYTKPNTDFINSMYTPNQQVSQLEDEAKQRGEINKDQLQQQLAQIKSQNENRREVRDVGQSMLAQQKQTEQSDRDAKRLDNETKKLGMEAETMESTNMERDARTKMIHNQLETADLALKNDKLRNDPNSNISDLGVEHYANQLDAIGMNDVADKIREGNFSIQQVEDLLGKTNLQNMVTQYNASELRKDLAAQANQTKLDVADTKAQAQKAKMAKPLSDAVAKLDTNLQYSKNNEDFPSFQKQLEEKNGINDLELMYKYMKLIDPKAVLRKDKSTLVMNADSPINKALNMPERITKGVMFSPEQRAALVNAAKNQLAVNNKAFQDQVAPIQAQAQAAGIPMEQIMPRGPTKSSGDEDMVKVVDPKGQTGSIPKKNLKEAIDRGFKEVQDGQ